VFGTVNTMALLTSSFFMAVAAQAGEAKLRRFAIACLVVTLALGVTFLVIKGFEYREDIEKHLLPGAAFALAATGTELFFSIYWVMTSVHALTRAGRSMGPELASVMDRQLRPRGASPPAFARRARRRRLTRLFHAARPNVRFDARRDVRPPRAALQPRGLVAKRSDRSAKFRALVQKLQHQPFQVAKRKRVYVRRRPLPIDSDNRRFWNPPPGIFYPPHQQPYAKPTFAPTFAPLLQISRFRSPPRGLIFPG
jgi:hypothetical protein